MPWKRAMVWCTGYNSLTATFMVSKDKQTWDARTQLPMAEFTVSPHEPDVILPTTEQGMARSEDGGRTFRLVRGAPALMLVSWAGDGTLIGVQPAVRCT